MNISPDGINHLAFLEGNESMMYKDSSGYPTIGIGHLLTPTELSSLHIIIGGQLVDWTAGLTQEQVSLLLEQDTSWAANAINKLVKVELTQNQFDALLSFVFNIGSTAFSKSSLLVALNAGYYDDIPDKMKQWVYSNKVKVPGLVNRRNAEVALWQQP